MAGYKAEATISEDGSLHLEHLPFSKGERVKVVVSATRPLTREWPEGYFESTFGAIADDSFVRHPQGDFELRETSSEVLA